MERYLPAALFSIGLIQIYYTYRKLQTTFGFDFPVILSAVCAYISCEKQKEDKQMTVRFHEAENQSAYAELVLALLVQAAMPQVMEQLEASCQQEARETLERSV